MNRQAFNTKTIAAPRGFTLLELLVVLTLLGIFASVLSLRVADVLSDGDLRLASRMVINQVNAARGQAVYGRTEKALRLNINLNTIYGVDPGQSGEAMSDWTGSSEQRSAGEMTLPQGVRLEDVVLFPRGKIQDGEVLIRFYANGAIDRSLIHLRNEADEAYTLEINPLTGQVKVHDRYIEQKMAL